MVAYTRFFTAWLTTLLDTLHNTSHFDVFLPSKGDKLPRKKNRPLARVNLLEQQLDILPYLDDSKSGDRQNF